MLINGGSDVLAYVESTSHGLAILHQLVDGKNIQYNIKFDDYFKYSKIDKVINHNFWRIFTSMQNDPIFVTSILLYLGIATYHKSKPGLVCTTNQNMSKFIVEYLAKQYTSGTSAFHQLLEKVNWFFILYSKLYLLGKHQTNDRYYSKCWSVL